MTPVALSIRFLQAQPDDRLVQLARAGHERAFEALIRRYRKALLAYCRHITASSGVSGDDILQQALLQAWIAIRTAETDVRDVRAWLYRIVHNVSMSQLRRPDHDPARAAVVTPLVASAGTRGVDQVVEQRIEIREALAGLAALPDLQRQAMMSAAIDGRTHDEIAASMGLSHGAVRGLIYRARATLRAAAAAVVPGPLVSWAAEHGSGGGSSGILELAVSGGSAGLGGALLKGGALVITVGALATTGGLTGIHHARHGSVARAPHGVARAGSLPRLSGRSESATRNVGGRTTGPASINGGHLTAATRGPGSSDRPVDHRVGRDQSGASTSTGISSGGDRSGSSDGSRGGSDGGGSPSVTVQASSRDSSGGHGDGSSGGGSSGPAVSGGGDARGTSGGDGGSGSDGGSTPTTTGVVSTLPGFSGGH